MRSYEWYEMPPCKQTRNLGILAAHPENELAPRVLCSCNACIRSRGGANDGVLLDCLWIDPDGSMNMKGASRLEWESICQSMAWYLIDLGGWLHMGAVHFVHICR